MNQEDMKSLLGLGDSSSNEMIERFMPLRTTKSPFLVPVQPGIPLVLVGPLLICLERVLLEKESIFKMIRIDL